MRARTFDTWCEERFVVSPPPSPQKQNKKLLSIKENGDGFTPQSGSFSPLFLFEDLSEKLNDSGLWDHIPKPTLEWVMHHLEMAALLYRDIVTCADNEGLVRALLHAIKHHLGCSSLILSSFRGMNSLARIAYEELFPISVQSGLEDSLDSVITDLHRFSSSQLMSLFAKLCGFLMSLTCMREYNINPLTNTKLFRDYTKLLAASPMTFTAEAFKTSLQALQVLLVNVKKFWLTGDARDLIFTSTRVTEWIALYDKLQRDFVVLSNPEPFGVSVETFQMELEKCIADGNYLKRNRALLDDSEAYSFDKRLSLVKDLERNFKLRQLAQSRRVPPFSLLINGPSSVGKSSVMQILFSHFSKVSTLLGKPLDGDPSYVYNRCVADEYWSGFSTYQWCIMLDDVAVNLPSKAVEDATLSEIMRIVNIMPWTPPQAELERKGVYPVEPKLFLASTNVKDLNASQWFSVPIAIQRRFPFVITVLPKPEYLRHSEHSANPMLDTSKLSPMEGQYDDYWSFKVEEVVPGPQVGGNPNRIVCAYKLIAEDWDMAQLLHWYGNAIKKHYDNLDSVTSAMSGYSKAPICPECYGSCVDDCTLNFKPECGVVSHSLAMLWALWLSTGCNTIAIFLATYVASLTFPQYVYAKNVLYIYYSALLHFGASGGGSSVLGLIFGFLYHLGVGRSIFIDGVVFLYTIYLESFPGIFLYYVIELWHQRGTWWTPVDLRLHLLRSLGHAAKNSTSRYLFYHRVFYDKVSKWCTSQVLKIAARKLKEKYVKSDLVTKLSFVVTSAVSLYFMYSFTSRGFNAVSDFFLRRKPLKEEGGSFSSHKPVPVKERANVWEWKEPPSISSYDLSRKLLSRKGITVEEQLKAFEGNCFYFTTHGSERSKFGRALGIGGQLYITNAHFLWDRPTSMTISKCKPTDAVGFRRTFNLAYGINVHTLEDKDLCMFRIIDLPNNPHLTEYMLENATRLPTTNGYRMRREEDGSITVDRHINIVNEMNRMELPEGSGSLTLDTYRSTAPRPTEDGDCGSPLFVEMDNRIILVGLHVGGKMDIAGRHKAFSTKITRELINTLALSFPPQSRIQPSFPVLESDKTGSIIVQAAIHPKSPFRFLQEYGSMEYYGSLQFRDGHTSKVGDTYLKQAFMEGTRDDGPFALRDEVRPPILRGYLPKHSTLDHAIQTYDTVNYQILELCKNGYLTDVLEKLPQSEIALIKPLDLDTAINGVPSVAFIDAMKRSTSAGFPWCESKRKHIVPICDSSGIPTDRVDVTPEMHTRIENILLRYENGIQYHPVFRANLKDEPVTIRKAEKGSTRTFSCAPMDFSLVMRKFLLPCVRVIQRNAFNFELAVGVQAPSYEWHLAYEHIVKHGTERIIAGDYSKFDKRMSPCFILAAFDIMRSLCKLAGYNATELLAIDCIAHDVAFATTDFYGDLVRFFGTNPSGHPLTVIVNSIVNSLYMRYAYYLLSPTRSVHDFRTNVSLLTYGDDNIMSVSPRIRFFDHTRVSRALKSIGVEYTMADKETESIAFIPISKATFLKRRFVFSEDLGAVVGPIDHDSISKRMVRCVKGKNYVPQQHMLAVIKDSLEDYFFYGRYVFEDRRAKFYSIAYENGLLDYVDNSNPFPSWDELLNRYNVASEPYRVKVLGKVEKEVLARSSESHFDTVVPQSGYSRILPVQRIQYLRGRAIQPYCSCVAPIQVGYERTGGADSTLSSNEYRVNNLLSNNTDTSAMGTTTPAMPIDVPSNSGVAQSELVTGYSQQQQTTQFSDNSMEALYTQPSYADPTRCMDKISTGELGDFLSRPTLVKTVTWIQDTPLSTVSTDVWSAFFSAAPILRKIENFAFFQGEIHIKLMINSSPFNYGALLAAYEPLKAFGYDLSSTSAVAALRTCEFSQFPHVWVLPQNSQGGEIVFPFMYDLDWLDLTRATEVANMGTLHLFEVTPLASANNTTGQDVDIQVYVWFEKVELSGLTHKAPLQMGYLSEVSSKVPQMWKAATSKSVDEYSKRPISSIAGTVAAVARPLTSIPGIGIFAKATEMGASAVSSIASLFGWTNPPNISNVEPVRQAPYHAFASAAVSVPGDTLTLDPKSELTIDPRSVGLGDIDELSIANIVQREAYIGTAYWSTADAPQSTLAAAPVQPLHYLRANNEISGDEIALPPVALMSQTFGYWRGDIIFRFKIIATEYHRGRLRFSWDPVASLFGSSANNNTSLNRIVDISLEKDIEIRIPYNQARHWLKTPNMLGLGVVPYLRVSGDIFADFVDDETNNGMLTMLVLNALSAPDPGATVSILIFIRGAPNLEFCVPKMPFDRTYSYFQPQSGEVSISGAHQDNPDQRQYDVYFGDPVRSLRTVMRRAHPNVSLMADFNGDPANFKLRYFMWTNTIFPYFNGFDPTSNFTGNSFVSGTKPYTWALNTPFHMWIPCFKGIRGSMYWHYENQSQDAYDRLSFEVRRELADPYVAPTRLGWQVGGFAGSTATISGMAYEETGSFDGGNETDTRSAAVLVSPFNGEGKSILMPNLFNYRFDTTRVSAFTTGANRPRKRRERIRVMTRYAPRITSVGNRENAQMIRRYFSIGPDFTVFFFLCVPRVYRYASLPGPA
jgi:hypothetical protein